MGFHELIVVPVPRPLAADIGRMIHPERRRQFGPVMIRYTFRTGTRAMGRVRTDGSHHEALPRPRAALHRLAVDLRHPRRFDAPPPSTNLR